jgi:cytochrome c
MNFEFNKVAGAVLGTALGIMVVGIVADMIYAPPHSEKPGYVIAVAEPGAGGEGTEGPAEPAVLPIADRLQTASADQGADDVGKCKTCHTFAKGEPNKVGPNLWGVVGANAVHGDFDFSDAMRAKGAEGMSWTYDNLDQFIADPKGFIPGTAMSYAGVKKPEERADIIAYLRTLSDDPLPLPQPTPAPTAEAPAAPTVAGETPPAAEPPATEAPPAAETPPAAEPPAAEAPPAAEPAPAPESPPAEAPAAPAPAEQSAEPPPADAAPAGHSDGAQAPPAPVETPATAPAESGGASSGDSGGAAPAPAQAEPPAEASSPEGAPDPDAPAQAPPAEAPVQ